MVLEKGRNHLLSLEAPFGPLGHFSNDELKFTQRHILGPDPWLEPRTFRRTEIDGERIFTGDVNNLPSTVGGGGVHADGKLPRFREDDFALLTEHGPVEGADVRRLADLLRRPRALLRRGGAVDRRGRHDGPDGNPFAAWRSGPYPMPPGADMFRTSLPMAAAERAGLHPYRAPTGVNSVDYDGRPGCNNCGFCGHYGCPIEAKGDPVAMLRARAAHRAVPGGPGGVRRRHRGGRIRPARHGRALPRPHRGAERGDPPVVEIRANHVVLAAGAFETPRLLLAAGIGNSSDQVGRNLMFHFQTLVVGGYPEPMFGAIRGRAVTGACTTTTSSATPPSAPPPRPPACRGSAAGSSSTAEPPDRCPEALIYGPGAHHGAAMRDSSLRRAAAGCSPCRVRTWPSPPTASTSIRRSRDVWGFPAGRVTYSSHRHELAASDHVGPILEAVLRDAGAEWTIVSSSPPLGDHGADSPLGMAPASYHIMGPPEWEPTRATRWWAPKVVCGTSTTS